MNRSPASSSIRFEVHGTSRAGRVKMHNDDCFLVMRFGRTFDALQTNLTQDEIPMRSQEVAYGLLVADGLGGRLDGDTPSRVALSTLIKFALDVPDWILGAGDADTVDVMHRADWFFRKVNTTLRDRGLDDPALSEMGTTLTAMRVFGNQAVLAHVGDSRAYLFRRREIHRLTRDHTYAQVLLDAGWGLSDPAGVEPFRNVVLNLIGGDTHEIKVDVDRTTLEDADWILLCTDGLTEMLTDSDIGDLLRRATGAQAAAEELVDRALRRGAEDDVTAIVARYTG